MLANIIKVFTLLYLAVTLYARDNKDRILFLLLIVGIFVIPFSSVIPMIGRFGYYFGVCGMVCYPIVLKDDMVMGVNGLSAKRVCSAGVLLSVVVLTIFEYMTFFVNPIWVDKFSTYHTIFEEL